MRRSVRLSSTAVVAALYAAVDSLGIGFPIVGVEGAKPISLAQGLGTGLSLAAQCPQVPAAVALGGLVASLARLSPPFYALNWVPAAVSALQAHLYSRGRFVAAALLYTTLVAALAFYPALGPASLLPHYTWFQVLALILPLAAARTRGVAWAFATSLSSAMAGQVAGTLLFLTTYGWGLGPTGVRAVWAVTALIYPVERTVLALVATMLSVAVARGAGQFLGAVGCGTPPRLGGYVHAQLPEDAHGPHGAEDGY